jgi:hypothetical protein
MSSLKNNHHNTNWKSILECYKPVYVGMTSPNQKSAIHEAKIRKSSV